MINAIYGLYRTVFADDVIVTAIILDYMIQFMSEITYLSHSVYYAIIMVFMINIYQTQRFHDDHPSPDDSVSIDEMSVNKSVYYIKVSQQLTSLDPPNPYVTNMFCNYNLLTELPPLHEGLIELSCSMCQIVELPPLPSTLNVLDCRNNQLTSLPSLPDSLLSLICSDNIIREISVFPRNLVIIHASSCELTSLPKLPPTLIDLAVNRNQLTELPTLPPTLKKLVCDNNQLTSLPAMPPVIELLVAGDNPITELPELPEKYINVDLRNINIPMFGNGWTPFGWTHLSHCRNYSHEMSKKRTVERCRILKEGIMIKAWAPERVLRMLEAGYDIEDM